jgi:hypothetical protein
MFSGALMLLAVVLVRGDPTRWGTVALFVAGALGAALKPTNAFAAIALAIFLLFRPSGSETRRIGRHRFHAWLRTGGALLVGSAISIAAWSLISGHRALIEGKNLPVFAVRRLNGFHLDLLLAEATNLLSPATGLVPSGLLTHPIQNFTTELIRTLFLVVAFSGLFAARRVWYHVLGLASGAALLLGGLGYGLFVWIALSMDPGAGSRYGLCILPLMAVSLAKLSERGRVTALVGALGVGATLATLVILTVG